MVKNYAPAPPERLMVLLVILWNKDMINRQYVQTIIIFLGTYVIIIMV